ncbi:MAG: hypothetical protein IJE07_09205 [Clostridia bacterium]|nr:hypothetical protein [Clostridia bacterium]
MKSMIRMTMLLGLAVLLLLMAGGCAKEEVSIIGVWTLTDMTGTDEAVQDMQAHREAGMKVSMAISSDEIEMVTTYSDSEAYDHQTVSYRIEGDLMITEAAEMAYTLTADTLTLQQGDVTMVFTRK